MSSSPDTLEPRPGLRPRIVAAVAVALVMLLVGSAALVGHQLYEARLRLATEQRYAELQSVALLKVRQLEAWRDDRLGDARLAASWAIAGGAARRWLDDVRDADARADLVARLEALREPGLGAGGEGARYQNIVVAAPDGRALLSLDPSLTALEASEVRLVGTAIETGGAVMGDLERDRWPGPVDIDLAAPLEDPAGVAFGALMLRTDPTIALYPIVAWWPTDSASAETLLVRREGDEAVFLSPRRHTSEPEATGRVPIGDQSVAAVAAATGREGRFAGLDYRGVRVLADLRRVPGSDWLLVAQVDEAELLAAARDEGVGTMVVILLLMLLAGSVVGLFLINRQRAVIGRLYRAERARSSLASRYDRLLAQARDIFLLVDDAGRIVDANDAATSAYGYSRGELLALGVGDLRDPASLGDLDRQWNEASSVAGVLFETVHRRRNGSSFPVEVSSRAIELEGRLYRQSLIRDISERRDSEAELQRLATAYATLAATNALIVHAEDEPSLLSGICATLVDSGGYLGAWVGVPDAAAGRVVPVAMAGEVAEHIRAVEVRLDDRQHPGQHPAATAWRENRPCYRDGIDASTTTAPSRPEAVARGIAAAGSLPLHGSGGPRAVLTIYSGERDAFTPATRALLEEMAEDISFALGMFDQRAIRRRAEEALVAKEAELATQVDELRRWYEVMIGREERALELKEEVNQLLVASGQDPRYGRHPGPDGPTPG